MSEKIGEKSKHKFDIHERIFGFVIRVIKLSKSLYKTPQNLIIINQITRSATSIGANDQEADGAQTRKDFHHCFTIVKKEIKETNYWLNIIYKTNFHLQIRMKNLIQEGRELESIISSIVSKT